MGKLSEKLDQIKVPQPAPVIGPKIELKPEPEMVKKQSGTIDKNAVDSLYKAQKLFYAKKYNSALAEINRSLKKQETALGYAIQGSLYYTLNEKDLAVESWRNALELDPDMEDVRQALSRYER